MRSRPPPEPRGDHPRQGIRDQAGPDVPATAAEQRWGSSMCLTTSRRIVPSLRPGAASQIPCLVSLRLHTVKVMSAPWSHVQWHGVAVAALKGVKLGYEPVRAQYLPLSPESLYNMEPDAGTSPSKGDTQIVVKGPEGIVERTLAGHVRSRTYRTSYPLVEAGILPKDLAVEIAKDFARSRGTTSTLCQERRRVSPRRATPGTPTPLSRSPQNPVATQPVGAQNGT